MKCVISLALNKECFPNTFHKHFLLLVGQIAPKFTPLVDPVAVVRLVGMLKQNSCFGSVKARVFTAGEISLMKSILVSQPQITNQHKTAIHTALSRSLASKIC